MPRVDSIAKPEKRRMSKATVARMINSLKEDNELASAEVAMIKYFRRRPDRFSEMFFGVDLTCIQRLLLLVAWYTPFSIVILTRGGGKTFMLSLILSCWALLYPNQRVGIIAASFRQSKLVFAEIERLYKRSPRYQRECTKPPVRGTDVCYVSFKNGSEIQALPLGNGEKIRGSRFFKLAIDEFAQIPEKIINVVVYGMTATYKDPVKNVNIERLKARLAKEGKSLPKYLKGAVGSGQNNIIATSTAYYRFNHLWKRVQTYIELITTKAVDPESKREIWKDYSLLKVPYDMIPKGFMNDVSIDMAKQNMSAMEFSMEYECKFPTDSGGFFPGSLVVESIAEDARSCIRLRGRANSRYILFVDPARTSDNCAFDIVELCKDFPYILCVHVSTIRGRKFQEAADHIWELHRKFNFIRIGMDSRGGGNAIKDCLGDSRLVPEGSKLMYDYEDSESYLDGDRMHIPKDGLHILHLVNFSNEWINNANHSLLSAFENGLFKFPVLLSQDLLVNLEEDQVADLEEAEESINELKKEIMRIVATKTVGGFIRFDTEAKKQRKDRYSALLGAVYEAREILKGNMGNSNVVELPTGGWAGKIKGKGGSGDYYDDIALCKNGKNQNSDVTELPV